MYDFFYSVHRMEGVLQEVRLLREEVKMLTEIVVRLEKSCSRMDDHITFVDHVYERVQRPMNFVLGKVSRLMGRSEQVLPQIEKNPEHDHDEDPAAA